MENKDSYDSGSYENRNSYDSGKRIHHSDSEKQGFVYFITRMFPIVTHVVMNRTIYDFILFFKTINEEKEFTLRYYYHEYFGTEKNVVKILDGLFVPYPDLINAC